MTVIALSKKNFDEVAQNNAIVLVDFWAEWCGPCKAFAETYQTVAEKYPDIIFAKVDTETESELAADFKVRSIPTLLIMKEQVVIYFDSGALPQSALEDLIKQAQEVDISELKAKICKQVEGSDE